MLSDTVRLHRTRVSYDRMLELRARRGGDGFYALEARPSEDCVFDVFKTELADLLLDVNNRLQ